MVRECIYNIDITTNNKDIISISSDDFNHFYIANIDDNGEELCYSKGQNSENLFANFFMIKILNNYSSKMKDSINRLLNKRDIVKIGISFTNGRYKEFDLAKKRVVNNGILENKYEDAFLDEDNLCIIISDKKIRYKENLFA